MATASTCLLEQRRRGRPLRIYLIRVSHSLFIMEYLFPQCIELGTIRRSVKGADGNNRVITEYMENELHDTVISSLLKQAYGMYRVANGTMESLVNAHDGNTRPLQRRLEEFFEAWVLGWDFEKTMTLERALDGINYLPMGKTGTMATDRLVKSVRDKYQGMMTHSMVTFEDLLVSSDIRDEDLRPVWKHVVQLTGYDGASASAAWSRKEEEEARKRKVPFTSLGPQGYVFLPLTLLTSRFLLDSP